MMMLSNLMKRKGVPSAHPLKKSKINPELNKGLQHESKEHPWLQPHQIRRLTQDHLNEHPNYYTNLQAMKPEEPQDMTSMPEEPTEPGLGPVQ